MKKVLVSDLVPGMVLAKDVILEDGKILLLSGFAIKPRYINKMASFNVEYVYIDEDQNIPVEELSEEKVYSEAFSATKNILNSVRQGEPVNVGIVKDTVENIIQKLINTDAVFMQLTGIRDIDNYTFLHSLDVCIFSLITGRKLGLSPFDLNELGVSALLHDVGKCKVPLNILKKPAKLNDDEFRIMKLHSVYGYEIISNTPGLSKRVANTACQHHEKWDGTGYPLGLKGYDIEKFARIVSIADVYDALISNRSYRKKLLPHIATEYIMGYSSVQFDSDIVEVFVKNIVTYPNGIIVLLDTGEIGTVIEDRHPLSMRPKLKIIARKDGPPILDPYILDLLEAPSVSIVDIIF